MTTVPVAGLTAAAADWMRRLLTDATAFVTLTVEGATPSPDEMRKLLRRFDLRLKRALLGRRWRRRRSEIGFVGVLEKEHVHPHFHMGFILRSPHSDDRRKQDAALFGGLVERIWSGVLGEHRLAGTADVRRFDPTRGAAAYMMKERRIENLILDFA